MRGSLAVILAAFAALALAAPPACAEAAAVRIAIQPGLAWLPFLLAGQQHLIEQRAAAAGLGAVTVDIRTVSGGGVENDALLSGSLDFASSGVPAFMILWDKAAAVMPIRAVCGFGSLPFYLVTRNKAVTTIKDFGQADRIALPTVRASGQAVILEMAAARAFGIANYARLDPLTVSRGQPDAMAALLSGKGEIDSHFSSPPYQEIELAAPGVHAVLKTTEILDHPLSNGVLYTTQRFHDANPKLFRAVMDGLGDADARINADRRAAAAFYVAATHQTLSVDQILAAMSSPGVEYTIAPQSVFTLASFMHEVGTVKHDVKSWKDLFFEEAHGLPGS